MEKGRNSKNKISERELRRRKALKKRKASLKASAKRRKNSGYRKIQLCYNLIFIIALLFIIIFGSMHVFTKKKSLRKEGIDYYNKGEYEAAIESFDKALKCKQWFSDSVNVDIEMYKADCYLKLSEYSDAERVYSSIKSKYPAKYYDRKKVDFLEELSDALDRYKYGDYVSTVACFNRAVEAGYTEMSIYAASCYEHTGDYEKMKENLDIYTANHGNTAEICYKYASYYLAMNDYESALSYVEQGIAFGDGVYYQEFLYARIICCEKKGEFDKAFGYAADYISTYPDDTKGADIYAWLDTRVNPDTDVVNDIFGQNGNTADDNNDDVPADSEIIQ